MTEYLRDPAAIYARSFAMIEAEADLSAFAEDEHPVITRMIHACGMIDIVDDLRISPGFSATGIRALRKRARIWTDCRMLQAGLLRNQMPTSLKVECLLDQDMSEQGSRRETTTRSAMAVEVAGERLNGALLAIGNAPTALFRALELIRENKIRPALIIALPVGFVGAAESKAQLIAERHDIPYVTLLGRRGGSAMAAAALNALLLRAYP